MGRELGGTRRFIAALGVLALLACTSEPDDDEDGAGEGAGTQTEDGCLRVCAVAAGCLQTAIADDDCLSACVPALVAYGDAAPALIDACADCVEREGCAALDADACSSVCGDLPGAVGGGGGAGGGGGGGSGGTGGGGGGGGGGTGLRCDAHYATPEGAGAVQCECYESSECLCDCYLDGIQDDSFWSNDFCSVDAAARLDRARRGCGWPDAS